MQIGAEVHGLVTFQVGLYGLAWLIAARMLPSERPAILSWAGFKAMLALGLWLLSQRDAQRSWWAYNGANLATLLAMLLMVRGCLIFLRHPPPPRAWNALWLLPLAALLLLPPSQDAAPWRVVVAYGGQGLLLLLAFFVLRQPLRAEFGRWPSWGLMAPMLGFALHNLGAAARQLWHWPLAQELQMNSTFNIAIFYSYLMATGVFAIGFMAVLTHRLTARLREASMHDELTGLLNRRAMNEYLRNQWHRHLRRRHPLALVMVDLDHFKRVNDTLGHAGGDAVLRATAALFRKHLRREDLVARMGGEEFLLLLPDTPEPAAQALCERLRQLAHDEQLGVTLSLGLTMVAAEDGDAEVAVRRADAALYRAKTEGRDRVVSAPAP
ncbi:diguanylate cyclase (GGDEF)-like protein [Inhella inkyongensis]|uniref:diguanylate cyclase n=1 Tax=Inhella inkyongensis TaxID=392593 RepID=A0A840S8E5_9BURK|nr:GGDEF domain-containing protein [Inhella inkyongensis]MBB5204689.1 diguanylate cyclase (GGDEF)-like protein [Inhella inkyongensis]